MVGKTVWAKEDVMSYESFETAIQSIIENSNRTKVSKNTESNYLDALRQYLKFVNSEEGLTKEITPDNLIMEAKQGIEKTKGRIRLFFLWLQGETLPNFQPRGKSMRQTSAFTRAYSQIKGFYTNNGVIFGKWKTPNLQDMKKEAIENDTNVPFFKLDKRRKVFLDRGIVKQFLANLKLRDQTIFLAMLSSSHDSSDIFSLSVGDVRKQKDRERFFWEGQRVKTGVRFKTFFSKEATDFIRRYIEQERKDAEDNEPLFLTSSYGNQTRKMAAKHLSGVFRDSAKKMGVKLEEGYQNPFRPKRLRHIFRTACSHAHVDEGYINAFMGHRTPISQEYLEKGLTILELEYSKAEPFLTVYGVGGTEGLEAIQTELAEWKGKYADLKVKVDDLSIELKTTQDAFNSWVREQYEADKQALLDLQKWREDFTRRYKEEVKKPPPLKEKISEKISKILEEKKEEAKPKPKKELSFHELIYGIEREDTNA